MNQLEIKAALNVDDKGVITGIAWPFGTPDRVGDVITKGAFNVAVDDCPMLFGHNPDDLIGTWTEIKETNEGLTVKGQLHLQSPRVRAVRGLIKGGLVGGLSIGFGIKSATKQGRGRVISALDLYEISVVRNPSHPRARVTSAKNFDSAPFIAVAEVINRATAAQLKR